MRAIVIDQPGSPKVMRLGELPEPVAGPGELLVRVRATALNHLDLLQRQGRYSVPAEEVALTRESSQYAPDRFADGRPVPVIDRVYELKDAPEAHRYMESNANVGMIILRVP